MKIFANVSLKLDYQNHYDNNISDDDDDDV